MYSFRQYLQLTHYRTTYSLELTALPTVYSLQHYLQLTDNSTTCSLKLTVLLPVCSLQFTAYTTTYSLQLTTLPTVYKYRNTDSLQLIALPIVRDTHPTSQRSFLILFSHLRLRFPSRLLPSDFLIKTLHATLSLSNMLHATQFRFSLFDHSNYIW